MKNIAQTKMNIAQTKTERKNGRGRTERRIERIRRSAPAMKRNADVTRRAARKLGPVGCARPRGTGRTWRGGLCLFLSMPFSFTTERGRTPNDREAPLVESGRKPSDISGGRMSYNAGVIGQGAPHLKTNIPHNRKINFEG